MSDSILTCTLSDAIECVGHEIVDAVLAHGRHRVDERGTIYWSADELAELVELVELEKALLFANHLRTATPASNGCARDHPKIEIEVNLTPAK